MTDHEPNSRRYWRMNEIAGLRLMQDAGPDSYGADPESFERHQQRTERFKELTLRERAVLERAQRLLASKTR